MYKRKVGPQNDGHYRWAADWWNYPEALARLEAMWRAWEHLRLDGATGSSVWWIEHADHHMPILLDPDGPFTKSTDRNKHGDPLPYTPPQTACFPTSESGPDDAPSSGRISGHLYGQSTFRGLTVARILGRAPSRGPAYG